MTDKEQIIIEGVDVVGCKYFNRFRSICHNKNLCCDCEKNQNCYYKQLARKTQECIKLNNKIIDMNSIIEDAVINLGNKDFTLYDLPFEIKKLRQECKESKAYAQRQENQRETYYKEFLKLSQECENLKAEEKYLKQCCQKAGEELAKHSFEYDGKEKNLVVQAIELNEKYEKLKKALEKIERICEKSSTEWEAYKDETCIFHCKTRKTDKAKLADKILNIINKVKGENNAQ